MVAEIVSVGTELLLGQIVDSDAQYMGRLLAELGISHLRRQTVGDNLERLVETLRLALERSDIVITIGGLGPTEDDLTRIGIAQALGDELIVDLDYENQLKALFQARNLSWTLSQVRQAERPTSAELIANPNGTAPGLLCRSQGKFVIAMPGPPGEFRPMADGPVKETLAKLATGGVIRSRTLRICGLGEALVEEKVRQLLDSSNPTVAPYAHPAEVHLRVTAKAASTEEAEKLIEPVAQQIRNILGDAVYGENDVDLETATVQMLRSRGETVSVAESCTGGMLGERITSVSGASDVFPGGVISYSNDVKANLLGVNPETLRRFGAVSEACSREMAAGVRAKLGTTYGVSITGIAGPDGGTKEKPVGLVYVSVASDSGVETLENRFRGIRETIRRRSTQSALILLRRRLIAQG